MIQYIAALGARKSGIVTITNRSMQDNNDDPLDSAQYVQFNPDGTIDDIHGVGGAEVTVQINAATDWIIPNGAASSQYEVRFITAPTDPYTTAATAINVWIDLSAARRYGYLVEGISFKQSGNVTFEIRRGGSLQDSGFFNLLAEVHAP